MSAQEVYAKAKYDFTPSHSDEITLQFNDVVTVVAQDATPEWWEVELHGFQGKAPACYLEIIEVADFPVTNALYDFISPDSTGRYFSFNTGDVIAVAESHHEDGWWTGFHLKSSKWGLFPSNYIDQECLVMNADGASLLTSSQEIDPKNPSAGGASSVVSSVAASARQAASPALADSSAVPAPPTPQTLDQLSSAQQLELYEPFTSLLVHPPDFSSLLLMYHYIDVASSESVARDLVHLYEPRGYVLDLIRIFIEIEVSVTLNEGTIFRNNSLSSHVLTAYAKMAGLEYLSKTLRPLIESISTSNLNFEIDPHKIADADQTETNTQNLSRFCQRFLHTIMESVGTAPISLRQTCNLLYTIVAQHFPTAKRKTVGGFFFLRFICPAVVSPEGYSVIDSIDVKTRRALILISKVLQTLSNGVQFGIKESFMIPMNTFITENLENVHYILDKISGPLPSADLEKLPEQTIDQKRAVLNRFHKQFHLILPKLARIEDDSPHKAIAKEFEAIIAALPPPIDDKPKPAVRAFAGNKRASLTLNEYMKMNAETEADKSTGGKKKGPGLLSQAVAGSSSSAAADSKKSAPKSKKKEKEKKTALEAPDHQNIACEGYLHRQSSSGRRQFKKQYFVLFEGTDKLFYFSSHEELFQKSPQGAIELTAQSVASHTGKIRSPPGWEIRLKAAGAEYVLIATLEDDKSMWLAALDRRFRFLNISNDDRSLLQKSLNDKLNLLQKDIEEARTRRAATTDPVEIKKIENFLEELFEKISKTRESLSRLKD